mgnify:CR=1 FL=1
MTRHTDKAKALAMRKKGMSYSAIKEKLDISKSTLSYWLSDLPLSRNQINALRAHSPKRIEKFRNTMREKKEKRIGEMFRIVSKEVGTFTQRELFIAGFFLYWAEGGKTKHYNITLSNTDPSMLRFYLKWVYSLGVPKEKIKVRLQLYSDMNIEKEIQFWATKLTVKSTQFKKPYIKESKLLDLTQKGFGHGTCNISVDDRDISEYVIQGLKHISSQFLSVRAPGLGR